MGGKASHGHKGDLHPPKRDNPTLETRKAFPDSGRAMSQASKNLKSVAGSAISRAGKVLKSGSGSVISHAGNVLKQGSGSDFSHKPAKKTSTKDKKTPTKKKTK